MAIRWPLMAGRSCGGEQRLADGAIGYWPPVPFSLIASVQAAVRAQGVATCTSPRPGLPRGRHRDAPRSSPDALGTGAAHTPHMKATDNARHLAVGRFRDAPREKGQTVSPGHGSSRPRRRFTRHQKSLVGLVGAGAVVGLAACGVATTNDSAPGATSEHPAVFAPTTTTGPPSTAPTAPPATTTAPAAPPATAPTPPPTTSASATTTTPAATPTTAPADLAPSPSTAPVDTGYGCADAVAYLKAHADPAYQIICPADSGPGSEAFTCSNLPGACVGFQEVIITDPCPAAYMNEASNTWVIDGKSDAPIDPYGSCENPVGVP